MSQSIEQYAREASIALGHLRDRGGASGGFYTKIGEEYYADARVCEELIRELRAELIREKTKRLEILKAEHELSEAYVRLRMIIPGALNTTNAPTPEEIWTHTENCLRVALDYKIGANE